MDKKICPECGIPISDWNRHRSGYRTKDSKGNIVYTSRCKRQHIRHDDPNKHKKGLKQIGHSYSQMF